MRTIKVVILAVAASSLLWSLAAGTAMALRSLSFSSRTIVLLSRALTLASTNLPGRVVCEIGLTVTLNENPIAKTARARIGRVRFQILRCSSGRATIAAGPFDVNYLGFLGTLPNILGLLFEILRCDMLISLGVLAEFRAVMDVLGLQEVIAGALGSFFGPFPGSSFALANGTVTRLAGFAPTFTEIRFTGSFEPVGSIRITLV